MQSNSSSRVFLLAAILVGVLATIIAVMLLPRGGEEASVRMLIARHDLPPNHVLDPERDLETLEVPERFRGLQGRSLSPDLAANYRGQRVNRPILAGQPIFYADLVAAADLQIRDPYRALSIAASGPHAVSGLLVPGDYVMAMVTLPVVRMDPLRRAPVPNDEDGVEEGPMFGGPGMRPEFETKLIIDQPLRVLAVDAQLVRTRQQISVADQYQAAWGADQQRTVTLEVTQEQARRILQETGAGQFTVTLILCPPPQNGAGSAGSVGGL